MTAARESVRVKETGGREPDRGFQGWAQPKVIQYLIRSAQLLAAVDRFQTRRVRYFCAEGGASASARVLLDPAPSRELRAEVALPDGNRASHPRASIGESGAFAAIVVERSCLVDPDCVNFLPGLRRQQASEDDIAEGAG